MRISDWSSGVCSSDLAVSGDQPLQRCDACCALLSARRAADRRLILGIKLRRAECCRDADSRASADTDVPDGSAVACRLAVEVGRARPWHQSTISRSASALEGSTGPAVITILPSGATSLRASGPRTDEWGCGKGWVST